MQNDPEGRAAAASRSTWVSVGVNVVLTALQLAVGMLAHSQALIADAMHSLSDLLSDFVVLIAGHHGRKAPDADHPYGHARFENAGSLVLGGLLLAVGAGLLWAALGKLQAPADIPRVHVAALWMALLTLAAKELLFRYLLGVAKRLRSSLLAANAWHARSDAASSLVVAAGIVGNLLGHPLLDPVAAAIVGFLVARMGWRFGWNALSDLMDRGADATEVEALRATAAATPGVRAVHDLRTRRMGDLLVVDLHLEVDASLTVEAGHAIAVAVHDRVMAAHPVLHVMTHVDPWHPPVQPVK
ncbi:cation diffusion facilitator family transporter [Aquincola sp. MAHUQ-54]|uniref:Cation diffusion facilitator family transporter n=1 Tax=Aquincola agrisoli TaxID=3119538 RepID=A0AAW9QAQ4_9BURK